MACLKMELVTKPLDFDRAQLSTEAPCWPSGSVTVCNFIINVLDSPFASSVAIYR